MKHSTSGDGALSLVLISSPSDVQTAREILASRIARIASNLRVELEGWRWRESTSHGMEYRSSETIQNQINEILDGRTELTFVMFGERIGKPFGQTPPDDAAALLDEWVSHGLTHPWPEDQAEEQAALSEGKFPLTGTVYEMLVAFGVERRERKLRLKVGYVADGQVRANTKIGDIQFNQRKEHEQLSGKPGSDEREHGEAIYKSQITGLINLFKALLKSDVELEPHRFDTEEEMAGAFGDLAEKALRRHASEDRDQQAFKPDLSHFSVDDLMKLPDRKDDRRRLHEKLPQAGIDGQILILKGLSGCGKSSLLQKGLLGQLKGELAWAIPIAIRPTDFTPRPEATPLRQFLGFLLDVLEERGVAGLHRVRQPAKGTTDAQLNAVVSGIADALQASGNRLVLGVDQFEEILDNVSLERPEDRAKPGSWWQLLRFIGQIVRQPGIWVAATLETQRLDRLEDMGLAEEGVLDTTYESVGFDSGDVKSFVLHVARDYGLPLDDSVADAVQRMAERFEKQRSSAMGGLANASFLPLLSLWMHRLFASFRDRLVVGEDGITGVFGTSTKLIKPEDVANRGLQFDLNNLVTDLVQDAWKEADSEFAAKLAGLGGYYIKDKDQFFNHLNGLMTARQDVRKIVEHCTTNRGFDADYFLSILTPEALEGFRGLERRPAELSEDDLRAIGNFYNGLIKLDASGNKRLTEMPRQSSVSAIKKLIETHLSRKLLEPVGDHSVRLVHQAVVDNWGPAIIWFESRLEYFQLRLKMERLLAEQPAGSDVKDDKSIADATRLLKHMNPVWATNLSCDLSASDRKLVDFCLDIVAAANGDEVFDLNERQASVLSIAASYGRVDIIDSWLGEKQSKGALSRLMFRFFGNQKNIVNKGLKPDGDSALHMAAWSSNEGVAALLRHGAQHDLASDEKWHPIASAVQAGTMDALRDLLARYDTNNPVIGPDGITLAHEAARSTTAEPLELLLPKLQAPLPVTNESKASPLHFAALSGRAKQAEQLVQFGGVAERDANNRTSLDWAVVGDYGETISAILDHTDLSDSDRQALLSSAKISDETVAASPLSLAAIFAAPKAMAALLEHCDNPLDDAHLEDGRHPLETLLYHNDTPSTTGSDQDRVLECLNLLMSNEHVAKSAVEKVMQFTKHLPEARRILENRFILDGDLSSVDPMTLLAFAQSPRQRVARAAVEKRPDILDHWVGDWKTGAHILLQKAPLGVLSTLLRRNILPSRMDPMLFSLQVGVRIIKEFGSDRELSDDQRASARRDAFIGIDRTILHPLIIEFLDESLPEDLASLIEIGSADGTVTPFLHRLAIRDEASLYDSVLSGMTGPIVRDAFGRLPSQLAPAVSQDAFTSIEKRYEAQRSVQ